MTIRNCQNCRQVIGHLEVAYSYYGRFVCKSCKTKLENPFQPPRTTNGDTETETLSTDERIGEDIDTESEIPVTEERAATERPHTILARKENSPDSESLKTILTSSKQNKTPNRNRTRLKSPWVGIGIFFLMGLFLVIIALALCPKLRDLLLNAMDEVIFDLSTEPLQRLF